LGATYFYLLTGQPPYDVSELPKLVAAHQEAPIPDPSQFNGEVSVHSTRIIQRCLAKTPAERYPSAQELAWDLRGTLRHLNRRTPAPAVSPRQPALKIAVHDDTVAPWIATLGLAARPFGPVDPSHCPYNGAPFFEARGKLKDFLDRKTESTLFLLGERGSGRSTLARQVLAEMSAETPLSYLDLGYGARPLKPGHTLPQWACQALGALPSTSSARDVYLDGLIEQLSASPQPALLVFDSVPEDAPYAGKLSSLVRAAQSTGCMRLILVGSSALFTNLRTLTGVDADAIATLEVPSLSAGESAAYVDAWLGAARGPGRLPIFMSPDAATLVHHRTGGNLGRINALVSNMLQFAALESRRVLTTWYAWRAPLESGWVADKECEFRRPPDWPVPEVMEILNHRARGR
jgi:hypothetical protein